MEGLATIRCWSLSTAKPPVDLRIGFAFHPKMTPGFSLPQCRAISMHFVGCSEEMSWHHRYFSASDWHMTCSTMLPALPSLRRPSSLGPSEPCTEMQSKRTKIGAHFMHCSTLWGRDRLRGNTRCRRYPCEATAGQPQVHRTMVLATMKATG